MELVLYNLLSSVKTYYVNKRKQTSNEWDTSSVDSSFREPLAGVKRQMPTYDITHEPPAETVVSGDVLSTLSEKLLIDSTKRPDVLRRQTEWYHG